MSRCCQLFLLWQEQRGRPVGLLLAVWQRVELLAFVRRPAAYQQQACPLLAERLALRPLALVPTPDDPPEADRSAAIRATSRRRFVRCVAPCDPPRRALLQLPD
ncbi:MAG: hypothetical protein ABJE10_00450 [bacterium]